MDQHIFDIFVSAKGTNNFSWLILYLECDGYLQHRSQVNWNNRIIESLKHDLHMPGCAIINGFVLTQNDLTSSRGLFNNHLIHLVCQWRYKLCMTNMYILRASFVLICLVQTYEKLHIIWWKPKFSLSSVLCIESVHYSDYFLPEF